MPAPNLPTLLAAAQLAIMVFVNQGPHPLDVSVCDPSITFTYGTYDFKETRASMIGLYALLLAFSYVHDVCWGALIHGLAKKWMTFKHAERVFGGVYFTSLIGCIILGLINTCAFNVILGSSNATRALPESAVRILADSNMAYVNDTSLMLATNTGDIGINVVFTGAVPAGCNEICARLPAGVSAAVPCWIPARAVESMRTLHHAIVSSAGVKFDVAILYGMYIVALVLMIGVAGGRSDEDWPCQAAPTPVVVAALPLDAPAALTRV